MGVGPKEEEQKANSGKVSDTIFIGEALVSPGAEKILAWREMLANYPLLVAVLYVMESMGGGGGGGGGFLGLSFLGGGYKEHGAPLKNYSETLLHTVEK